MEGELNQIDQIGDDLDNLLAIPSISANCCPSSQFIYSVRTHRAAVSSKSQYIDHY